MHQRGFAAAGGAHNCYKLPVVNAKSDVFQNFGFLPARDISFADAGAVYHGIKMKLNF